MAFVETTGCISALKSSGRVSDNLSLIHIFGGACGNATGRNIHQRSLDEAVRLTKAISAITLADYDVDRALKVFNGEEDFAL